MTRLSSPDKYSLPQTGSGWLYVASDVKKLIDWAQCTFAPRETRLIDITCAHLMKPTGPTGPLHVSQL